MKLLLDSSLPRSLTENSTALLEVEDAPGQLGDLSDAEIVHFAADNGFDAVAFLGRDTLASIPVVASAAQDGVALVITHTDEPVEAERHIAEHFRALEREVGPGRLVLVLRSGLRIYDLDSRV